MIRRSPLVNINSNRMHTPMRISQFLSDLLMMDDDTAKIMKLDDFICSLEDELKRIFVSQQQLPFCVLFLNEAITRFKELKRTCEVHAITKIIKSYKRTFDKDTKSKGILVVDNERKDRLSSAKLWTTTAHINNREVINIGSDDEVSNISSPSIHGSISMPSALAIHSGPIGFDPREKRVRNSFGSPSVMVGQEPPAKRRRIWPVELHRRFQHVVNSLGGPTVATPKEIKDLMQVSDITEDEIINHLMKYKLDNGCRAHGASPLTQFHNTRSILGQDVPKMSGNRIQSGSQQVPLHIGESSNGQATRYKTNDGWLIYSVRGPCSAPTEDMSKMRGMPVQSGSLQMPLYAGESSSSRMAAAPHNANGGGKLISDPRIHGNGPMNNHM